MSETKQTTKRTNWLAGEARTGLEVQAADVWVRIAGRTVIRRQDGSFLASRGEWARIDFPTQGALLTWLESLRLAEERRANAWPTSCLPLEVSFVM